MLFCFIAAKVILTSACTHTIHSFIHSSIHPFIHTHTHTHTYIYTYTHTHTHCSQLLLYFLVMLHLSESLSKASHLTLIYAVYEDVFFSCFPLTLRKVSDTLPPSLFILKLANSVLLFFEKRRLSLDFALLMH